MLRLMLFAITCSSCALNTFEPANIWTGSIEANGIRIAVLNNAAGAISSLTWGGVEFVDSSDHGRLLQSAADYENVSEAYNPTEAGSGPDASIDNPSSSNLLDISFGLNVLTSSVHPAFWFPFYGHAVSPDTISKRVVIGYLGHTNVVDYYTNFHVTQSHNGVAFETLTGYMPGETFTAYYDYTANGLVIARQQADDTIATIMATADGSHAMAVKSLNANSYTANWRNTLMGAVIPTTKWNVTFYPKGQIAPGDYTFHNLLIIGTLAEVVDTLKSL